MRLVAWVVIALTTAGCGGSDDEPPALANGDIVFASKRDGDWDIFVMRATGVGARNLTANAATGASEMDDDQPVWSDDGTQIAFLSTRDHRGDGDESRDVYVMDAHGRNVRRLTENDAAERNPEWLPDGRLAFWRCQGGVFGCAVVAIAPGEADEETLFWAGNGVSGLSISPEGESIAFNRWDVNSSNTDTNVVVSDLDGSGERPLTTAPGVDGDAEWSPDGTRLVFSSDRDRNGPCLFHDCTGFAPELYVMNADGTGVRRLTNDRGYDIAATWSPDGKQILFGRIGDQNDDYELYVVAVDGGQARRLTDNSGWDLMPDWAATGTK